MITFWDLAFMQLCTMLLHPGYQKEGTRVPSISELADMADELEKVQQCRRSP